MRNYENNFCIPIIFILQLGTLGAGNHYAEIQVVEEIYDAHASKKMGIDHEGQVCVMIHSGSRGMGHQVATGKLTRTTRCNNWALQCSAWYQEEGIGIYKGHQIAKDKLKYKR